MTILKSFDVETLLTSSNIQADSVATYISTTSYDIDQEVAFDGRIYISMANSNKGNQPDFFPLKWDNDRPSNPVALFDDYPATISTNIDEDIILEFDSDDTTLIALGSLFGETLRLELIDKSTSEIVYTKEIPLFYYDEPQDIYDYFFVFNELEKRVHFIRVLPMYFGCTLRITITKESNKSEIGFIQFGQARKMGCTLRDTVRFNNKSGIELQRIQGKLIPVETVGYSQLSIPIFVEKLEDIYPIRKELNKYRGKPLVILGDDTGENLAYTMIGIYTEIEESISTHMEYTITVNSMDETI